MSENGCICVFLVIGSITMLPMGSIAIAANKYVNNLPVGTCFVQQGNAIDNFGSISSSVIIKNIPLILSPSDTCIVFGNLTTELIFPPPPNFNLKQKSEVESFKASVTSTETVSCHYDLEKGVAYQAAIGIVGWVFGIVSASLVLLICLIIFCYVLRFTCIYAIKAHGQLNISTALNKVTIQ